MSFTLLTAKDAELSVKTLLLVTLTWADGTIRRYSTLDVTIDGLHYTGKVLDESLQPIVAMDQLGIDRIPLVTVKLADDDSSIWQGDEMAKGHQGASMQLVLRAYDLETDTPSTDSDLKFLGPCKVPNKDNSTGEITLTASNGANTQQRKLPDARRQSTCFKTFPGTLASQVDSRNPDSPAHACGYDPTNGRGTGSFADCPKTKGPCTDRGMFTLGAFAGVTFVPPLNWRGRAFVDKSVVQGTNTVNPDAWGAPYPMPFGTTWVNPVIENVIGDPNTTRFEATLCVGQLRGTRDTDPGSVIKVIVNDEEVPFRPYSNDQKVFGWNWVNNGARDGSPNPDAGYIDTSGNKLGDPHGSKAVIWVVVPRQVGGSDSVPRVQVLLRGPAIPKYVKLTNIVVSGGVATANLVGTNTDIASNDPNYPVYVVGNAIAGLYHGLTNWTSTTVVFNAPGVANGTYAGGYLRYGAETGNPVWVTAAIEEQLDRRTTTWDIDSLIASAAIADVQTSYTDATGASTNVDADGSPHRRFEVSYTLNGLKSAADVLSGIRGGFNGYLDSVNGKTALRIEGPLGEQQPAPIAGSNYNSAISSTLRDGSTGSGYVAYDFGPSSIKFDANGNASIKSARQQDAPNRLQGQFQDKGNQWQVDTLDEPDSAQIALAGAEFSAGLPALGPNTYDQMMRLAARYLAKLHRGNPTATPTGSHGYTFETSVKAEHLRSGHIVRLSDTQEGLVNQLFRVTNIEPATDYEDMRITVLWHSDLPYADTYGQPGGMSPASSAGQTPTDRAPYPWGPALISPFSGDPLYPLHDTTFDIEPDFNLIGADGNPIPAIALNGKCPVNICGAAQPPIVAPQATITAGAGPFVGPASYWLAVCAADSLGNLSAPSLYARADIPTGVTAASITIKVPNWGTGTAGYSLFAGRDPRRMNLQASVTGSTPATITLSTYFPSFYALPDPSIVAMRAQVKAVISSGVFQGVVSASNSTTITIAGASWTTNQWAGRAVSNLSTPYLADFAIVSNTGNVLTVTPNPIASGGGSRSYSRTGTGGASRFRAGVGDVLVIRAQPTVTINADNSVTFTDASWVLSIIDNGMVDYICRIVAGTGRGKYARIISNTATSITTAPFTTIPDTTSVPIIEAADWVLTPRTAIANSSLERLVSIEVPVANYSGKVAIVQVFTINAAGLASLEDLSPFRETFIGGAAGTGAGVAAPGDFTGLTLDSITYDTVNVTMVGHGALPVSLNDLTGGLLYGVIGTDYDHTPFQWDAPYKAGDVRWNWTITMPVPAVDLALILYAIPYNASVQGVLVTGLTSPSPNISFTVSANVPGPVTSPSVPTVDVSDGLKEVITGTWLPPSPLKGFNACEIWYQDVTLGSTDTIQHDYGVVNYDGSGTFKYILSFDRLATNRSYKIWFVSANDAITETLIPTGGSASPNITVIIQARTSSGAPLPATPGTVVASAIYNPGPANRWGLVLDVTAPGAGWSTIDTMRVQLVRVTPASPHFENTPYITDKIPTGSTHFLNTTSPQWFKPTFVAPTGTADEVWRAEVTGINVDGVEGTTAVSANFTVVAGGSETPAPLIPGLTATEFYVDNKWGAVLVFTLPADYAYIDSVDIYNYGPLTSPKPRTVGSIGGYQFTSTTFTFTVDATYSRPGSGTEQFQFYGIPRSGAGIASAAKISNTVTINAVGGAGMAATAVSATASVKHDVEGGQITSIILSFTTPTNTDAKALFINYQDLGGSTAQLPLTKQDIESNGGWGFASYFAFDTHALITTFRFFIYTVDANSVIVASATYDLAILASAGKGKANRLDPTTIVSAMVSPTTFIAGNLSVAMNIASGGAIIMNGSGTSGAFSVNINPTDGIKVSSSINQCESDLNSGSLIVKGNAGLAANFSSRYGWDTITLLNNAGWGATLSVGPTTGNPGISFLPLSGGGVSAAFFASSSGDELQMPHSGSEIQLNGSLKVGVFGSFKFVCDSSGFLYGNPTTIGAGGVMPATYARTLKWKDQFGTIYELLSK